jgi:hypothetical protein
MDLREALAAVAVEQPETVETRVEPLGAMAALALATHYAQAQLNTMAAVVAVGLAAPVAPAELAAAAVQLRAAVRGLAQQIQAAAVRAVLLRVEP